VKTGITDIDIMFPSVCTSRENRREEDSTVLWA